MHHYRRKLIICSYASIFYMEIFQALTKFQHRIRMRSYLPYRIPFLIKVESSIACKFTFFWTFTMCTTRWIAYHVCESLLTRENLISEFLTFLSYHIMLTNIPFHSNAVVLKKDCELLFMIETGFSLRLNDWRLILCII